MSEPGYTYYWPRPDEPQGEPVRPSDAAFVEAVRAAIPEAGDV